jgi:DNA helicase HerA-like ATPase
VLSIVFKAADDNGLLLLDLKDLRAMLQFVSDNADQIRTHYGNVSAASVGAIQRGLLTIEQEGGDKFFGEPALDLQDLLQASDDGRGVINILAADKLMQSPKLYATFLLWLLSQLFEVLPEVGDPEKPVLVFFFDEAHLLFDDVPKVLMDKIQQVIRLVRSKGVGVYFVTQNPLDVPDPVLGQLGNRVQHALRAFTPRDQKAVKAAAETFRANKGVDVSMVITELGVGEALVSVLDATGTPTPVERAFIYPPESRVGSITPQERQQVIQKSVLFGHYEKMIDRESAYEKLTQKTGAALDRSAQQSTPGQTSQQSAGAPAQSSGRGWFGDLMKEGGAILTAPTGRSGRGESLAESMAKSTVRAMGSSVGRQIARGILGSILGGTSSRSRY